MWNPSWAPAIAFGFCCRRFAFRSSGLLGRKPVSQCSVLGLCATLVAALWLAGRLVTNEYVFFMGYAVAQYVLLATAWNLLGAMPATSISAPPPSSRWRLRSRWRSTSSSRSLAGADPGGRRGRGRGRGWPWDT